MSGYLPMIVHFLESKGLSKIAIAGIVGNLKVESDFNPEAFNSGEGAIGFGQWEGGRRQALAAWALNHHGAQETDAQSQLEFMWHELTTGYTGVLSQLRSATSVQQAAAIWDSQYEISSGDSRGDRISYAQQWYSGQPLSGSTGPSSDYQAYTAGSGGSGGGDAMTRSDYANVDDLGKLLSKIPELSKLLDQALANNWSSDKFQNAVEDSNWYKNNSSSARAAIVQRANDPATWQQNLTNTRNTISQLAHQLGMPLTPDELNAIATHALLTGNHSNQQWLTERISNHQDYSDLKSTDNLRGGMAAVSGQLQQLAAAYGIHWDASQLALRAQNVLDGTTTIDTYKNQLVDWAKSAFPGLSEQIAGGQTVRQLADPYVQSMSQLLEMNPGQLDLYTPKIRQALQGVWDHKAKARVPLSVTEFEDQVRQDPRWQYTQNARDTMSSALVKLGADFGFGPEG